MEIAVCGKTNVGKTTFFSAATLVDAEISSRVFTTIKPNRGVTYARAGCPCKELNLKCSPQNSKCVGGSRLVPVKLVDIAGLVPGAHLGKGLGNQFLSEIMEADAVIHVVDVSGSTDINGNIVQAGSHDPEEDIIFFEKELDYWLLGIAKRGLLKHVTEKELPSVLAKQLSGLKIQQKSIEQLVKEKNITPGSPDSGFLSFLKALRERSKPVLIAANKMDVPEAKKNYERLSGKYSIVACSAATELALRKAAEKGLVKYVPGDSVRGLEITGSMTSQQKEAIAKMKESLPMDSTGVQDAIDKAVFSLLQMIVVYPVENEHRLSNRQGQVLPDALLMKKGSTALDLAYKIHEDIGKKFVSAVDARTGRSISADYQLKHNDIISVKSGK